MSLSRLSVHNYRNIENAELTFSHYFNFILGENGSGKTNLLESLYVLGHGRTFRPAQIQQMIRHGQSHYTLFGVISDTKKLTQVGLSKSRSNETTIRIDGSDGHRLAKLAQLLPMQLISPEGFTLLTGGPKFRRAYLDWGGFHHFIDFFTIWNQLKQLLKQRNAALRQVTHYQQLAPWDQQLITVSEQITQFRQQYCAMIAPNLLQHCHYFLPDYEFDCQFYPGWDDKEYSYAQQLKKQFERDKMVGYTTQGPHKADFRIKAENIAIELLFSRGQLKLMMCALRIAQGELLASAKQQRCIYLIDDFSAELDLQKRTLLFNKLKQTQSQVFISAIEYAQISDLADEKDKIFNVNCGKITQGFN